MEISNEEKATEIALSNDIYDTTEVYQSDVVDMLMEMAQWKDEQSAQEKQQLIDKAAEWLRMTMDFFNNGEFNTEKFVNDFKKETSSFDEEQYMRLWTIEDAKDGDVLVIESGRRNNECLFIFKDIACREVLEHCYYRTNDSTFSPTGSFIGYLDNIYHPATKEQCILLFSKMKEAGYEWDADKKELKPTNNRFDYENANIQQKDFTPKASTANRQLYNRAILKILSNYVEEYPDIRFGQMLCNLGIGPVFNEESRETYCNLNETINKKS